MLLWAMTPAYLRDSQKAMNITFPCLASVSGGQVKRRNEAPQLHQEDIIVDDISARRIKPLNRQHGGDVSVVEAEE